jgi:hypothetical protein
MAIFQFDGGRFEGQGAASLPRPDREDRVEMHCEPALPQAHFL